MERTKRTEKTELSRLEPININELSQSDDCFGKAWDPQHRSCSVCADVDICGVVFQETVVIPKKKKFDESLPLDLSDFQKVDWAKIGKLATKYQSDGEPMTYEELMRIIKDLSGMKDEFMIKMYIEKNLRENGLMTNDYGEVLPNA